MSKTADIVTLKHVLSMNGIKIDLRIWVLFRNFGIAMVFNATQ